MAESIEKLQEKVAKDPSKFFLPLAEELRKAKRFDEALEVLTAGLEKQPGYMTARVALGKIYLDKEMVQEAKSEFELVIGAIPGNLFAQRKLADIYRDAGDIESAMSRYKAVLKLNPMDEDVISILKELESSRSNPHPAPTTLETTSFDATVKTSASKPTPAEEAPETVIIHEEPTAADDLTIVKDSMLMENFEVIPQSEPPAPPDDESIVGGFDFPADSGDSDNAGERDDDALSLEGFEDELEKTEDITSMPGASGNKNLAWGELDKQEPEETPMQSAPAETVMFQSHEETELSDTAEEPSSDSDYLLPENDVVPETLSFESLEKDAGKADDSDDLAWELPDEEIAQPDETVSLEQLSADMSKEADAFESSDSPEEWQLQDEESAVQDAGTLLSTPESLGLVDVSEPIEEPSETVIFKAPPTQAEPDADLAWEMPSQEMQEPFSGAEIAETVFFENKTEEADATIAKQPARPAPPALPAMADMTMPPKARPVQSARPTPQKAVASVVPASRPRAPEPPEFRDADEWIEKGNFYRALQIYNGMLKNSPDDRKIMQRLSELRGLIKMLKKGKDVKVDALDYFLEGIIKKRDEFFRNA